MLAHTFSIARASGKSKGSTLSPDTQDFVADRPAVAAASRNRATVNAANMSPVPLKKTSISETVMRNRRGVWSERAVEPTMERVGEPGVPVEEAEGSSGKRTEVTIM